MPTRKKKPAHKLTDAEVVKRLFPKPVRHHVKKVAAPAKRGK
jgi:hypothetical protein